MAYPDRISDRIEYWCTLAELALLACHRTGLLLQESAKRKCQRLIAGITCFRHFSSCRTLWYGTGYCKSRRLVRTVLRKYVRNVLQQWCNGLYHCAGRLHYLGYIRKLHGEKQDAHGHLLRVDYRPVGYPILRTRNKCCSNRYYSYRFPVLLSQSEDAGKHEREISHFRAYAEHIIALYNDDRHRIFFLCHHRDPLYSQYADGPELT